MVVSPLWRGPGNIHGFVLDGKSYRQGNRLLFKHHVRNNVDLMRVQPYYYRARQVAPCRRFGELAQALFLSN